jgi:hypothetical protein
VLSIANDGDPPDLVITRQVQLTLVELCVRMQKFGEFMRTHSSERRSLTGIFM